MNKKGIYNQTIIVIVIAFFLGAILLLVFLGSIFLPVISKVGTDVTSAFQSQVAQQGDANLTAASTAAIEPVGTGLLTLEWISYGIIIFTFFSFLLMCYYVRTYPFLAYIWILLIVMLLVVTLMLTVSYQNIISSGGYAAEAIQGWENTNFIMNYLPHIVLAIGILGGILMFILSPRDTEAEAFPI